MNIQRWIARREANWKRLDVLLQQVEKQGLKSLNAEEIRELASLYRSVSADLARAKTNQVGQILTQNLQKLTSRSYSQIYQGSRPQEWGAVKEFYRWGFPVIVQQTWIYTAIATAIFLFGTLVAWWYAWRDPAFISLVIPEELISKVRDDRELWMGKIIGVEPLASSGIMVNNLSVSFYTIMGGVTMYMQELHFIAPPGLFTIYLLLNNGIHLGAVSTLVSQNKLAYPFWAFVFPHGSLELPAIFLAGGAGLILARGILFPGNYRRADALKFYGSQAAQLVFGIVPMLTIAGIIEGFFSPNPLIPEPIKYLTGIMLFTLLIVYCTRKKKLA
ncbi:uncharacterized membrane protein [Pleurocapsa sp. PCC 7327]|uniref:stage II sporulation protein M n=1 Tax=Pleurocapsa sp. PCC 7327 TaxID=118163 RepID=UPI00029F8A3F|nr:stage II sporulation protein M [Pleurocapsa sp. PCC 7327]AFY76608.1 uncharacterized membrane protein [Pleurocapsa sp. PCC 7327]